MIKEREIGRRGDAEIIVQLPLPDSQSPLELVRQLVAQRAELPPEAVNQNSRLLNDLHLNSITVSQLVTEAARCLKLAPPTSPTDYADATVADIAQALAELSHLGETNLSSEETQLPAGVDAWIRSFTVELVESPLVTSPSGLGLGARNASLMSIFTPPDYPLATVLQERINQCQGTGVVVCLPPEPDESQIELLLEGAKAVLADVEAQNSLIIVQHSGGAAPFARTFYLENPKITTRIVDVPLHHPQAIDWIVAEIQAAQGYTEAYYDQQGKRRSPVLRLLPSPSPHSNPYLLSPKDLLLVTGGGKGIAAECALSLAKEMGVRLVLLGRSTPQTYTELIHNLDRMAALGIAVKYLCVDVTDSQAVQEAVCQVECELGNITAIIHGAGINTPKLIKNLEKKDFLATLAPKVREIRNLLAAINPDSLRFLISFGSIIARTGLPGEADYALANEWLSREVEQFQCQHPHCRCLNLEWSV